MSESGYMTVLEVAELARCEHKAVRRAVANGHLRAFKPVRALVIREEDARAWIEGRPVTAAAPTPRKPSPRRSTRPAGKGSVADLRAIEERLAS